MPSPLPSIGCHVSIAGGLSHAVERAVSRGCECAQVFSTSPRMWKHQAHQPGEISGFRAGMEAAGISPIVVHAIYLLNLASEDAGLRGKSSINLAESMRFAGEIGASTVIIHAGHCPADEMDRGLQRVAECVEKVLAGSPPSVSLSLEMGSGGKTTVGTAEHFKRILGLAGRNRRLMFWLDTAHAFGAGYDLRKAEGVERLVSDFRDSVGLERVSGLHSNDSKAGCGTARDLHENIGEGFIGLEGFRHIVNHPFLRTIPFIAEIPGFDQSGPDKRNLDILKEIRR